MDPAIEVRLARNQLSAGTVASRSPGARAYRYDRTKLVPGIVHLGLGAFARAHLCDYTDDILDREFGPWGVTGISLRRPDQREKLAPQDGLYTALCRAPAGDTARIIGCVKDVLVAAECPQTAVARMAASATRIVSLTITEKGYCHDLVTGRLQDTNADIRHDLENPNLPRSAIGAIVAALARRRADNLAPFTVLCCDNLPHNGALLSGLVRDFAALRSDGLAAWIERHGAFPGTMVDRIVPASTDADIAAAERLTGLRDAAPVAHEPFRQWVIEDRFVDDDRPAWHKVGAEVVTDVTPFETMKLRVLNGSHSALAYLGYLGGHETIGDCAADPAYRAFVEALWRQEIVPVTPAPPATDLNAYANSLLGRYENPGIRHRTWQIAMDGSQKLPQRILATIRLRLERGLPVERLALVVAAWMVYVGGVDEKGKPIDVRDPLADAFCAALAPAGKDAAARVAALLGIEAVFGCDLPANDLFRRAVEGAYARLSAVGARRAVASLG